jgi:hypothetical protein
MVDWDRVEELRSKGWDWDRIADDPKVGFHPEASVREPGRALRAIYHRQRSRQKRQAEVVRPRKPTREEREQAERKWGLARLGYLLVPILAIWFLIAYFAPSPVGIILPAIPWLALGLAVAGFILVFGLLRSEKRWSAVFRTTVTSGIILGLLVSGIIGLTALLAFGCPYLPPPSLLKSEPAGWSAASVSAWQDGGRAVVYSYGATWCPYCSASSWPVWKALTEFGSVTGNTTSYSSTGDVSPATPEIVLSAISLRSTTVSFQASEDTSGTDGTFPGTTSCFQQAYVTAYSGGSIPFVVVNGQYVHGGTTLVNPADLATWANGANGGASTVLNSVATENGAPWSVIQTQAWWVMAYMAKSTGATPANLASQPYAAGWSAIDKTNVASDLGQIS